jgi:CBS domain-containing protein
MTVARILAEKGRCVVTTRPSKTLNEAASELARNRIGALVVLDGNEEIAGVICERDIVWAVAQRGPSVLSERVANYMAVNPRVIAEQDTVDATMEAMTVERRRHMPVVSAGRLCGIVSIGDVVKYRIQAIESERKALRDYIATA